MPSLKFKSSSTPGAVPANGSLVQGEIAINYADKKAWVGNAAGNPVSIIGSVANQQADSVNITGGAIQVGNFGTTTATTATLGTVTVGGTALSSISSSSNSPAATKPMGGAGVYYEADKLAGRLKNVYTYSGSGTYTYQKSGPDVVTLHVICVGGGGGARAYSECGGAGGFGEKIIDVSGLAANATVSVTVGGGGGGGVYFGFSSDGGTTSFGSYVSASGGYGANRNESHSGGHGGIGTGGNINSYGGSGSSHSNNDQYSPSNACQGQGGASYFGGGMAGDRPDWTISQVAAPGTGGIAISPGHNGQGGRSGRDGVCVVYEYV